MRHLKRYYIAFGWERYLQLHLQCPQQRRKQLASEQAAWTGATNRARGKLGESRDVGEGERERERGKEEHGEENGCCNHLHAATCGKPGARSAIWQYFGLKTNGKARQLTLMHHCVNSVLKHAWLRTETPPTYLFTLTILKLFFECIKKSLVFWILFRCSKSVLSAIRKCECFESFFILFILKLYALEKLVFVVFYFIYWLICYCSEIFY